MWGDWRPPFCLVSLCIEKHEVCSLWDGILSAQTCMSSKHSHKFGFVIHHLFELKSELLYSSFLVTLLRYYPVTSTHSQCETSWGPLHPEIPGLSGGWNCMCLVFPRVEHSVSRMSLYWICHKTPFCGILCEVKIITLIRLLDRCTYFCQLSWSDNAHHTKISWIVNFIDGNCL